jgi:hypothetical protein
MTPDDLLAAARELMVRPDAGTVGVWPRTSAFLARQALERAISARWEALPETAALADCPMRSQLICLPFYIERDTAAQAAHTWAALSNACHYHRYELAPTAAELTGWIDDAAGIVTQLRNGAPAAA